MSFAWFCTFSHPDPAVVLAPADADYIGGLLQGAALSGNARMHTPDHATDPYSDDGRGPALVIELEFDDLAACEFALEAGGPLRRLADPGCVPSLEGAEVRQQGFLARHYDVPDPRPEAVELCTYLVHYPGPAADVRAWHYHYAHYHPAIMVTFPGVREVAIYTPGEIISGLPFAPASAMQRNKVTFDDAAALDAALHSPVREAMRADFEQFPPFQGGNAHYPMRTRLY